MCNNPLIVRTLYLFKTSINIIKFVIPIGLIIMITIDLYKNLIIGKDNNNLKKIGTRLFAAFLVFIIPTLINYIFDIFSINTTSSNFASCYSEASIELANKLQQEEDLKLAQSEEENRKQALLESQLNSAKLKAMQEENIKRNQSANSGGSTYSDTTTDMNKQNHVYIKNGVFYAPKYRSGNKSTYSGRDCPGDHPEKKGYNNKYGYNNYFWTMLQNFREGLKKAGYNINYSNQGCRSYSYQTSFYARAEPGRAAKPGRSNHGWGIASDVDFYKNATTKCGSGRNYKNCPGMKWAHEHAKEYGLTFPLLNASYKEDWHIEPLNLKKY